MMEWIVVCGRSLAMEMRVRAVVNVAYVILSHKAKNAPEVFEPLLLGLVRLAKRSRVVRMAIVLVQIRCDTGQVPVCECLTQFAYELDLWGIGEIAWVDRCHCDGAIEGGFSADLEAGLTLRRRLTLGYIPARVPRHKFTYGLGHARPPNGDSRLSVRNSGLAWCGMGYDRRPGSVKNRLITTWRRAVGPQAATVAASTIRTTLFTEAIANVEHDRL